VHADSDDQQAVIESRIRRALSLSAEASRLFGRLPADPDHRSEGRGAALRLMGELADLVGFGLSSRLKGVGRVSSVVRGALRRGLFEVFFRQSEFNRISGEFVRDHEVQLDALGATVRAQLGLQLGAEERLDELERRLSRVEVNSGDIDYLSLVERFYGGVEERREELRDFVPRFVGRSEVIDAGCGRGEFLELLREAGVPAVGVDRDEAMVGWCRGRGLDAVRGEVLEFLRGRAEGSLDGIFGGYLVEHLERGNVVELVRLAFSRLGPGGLLVLEAVNPSCLLTYAGFYGDLTRVAAVPPLALKWLAESCGFVSVGVEYAGPVPEAEKLRPLPDSAGEGAVEAFNRGVAAANDLLFGFRAYVLTAQKPD
jgi:SAM-dependent methyltransferase